MRLRLLVVVCLLAATVVGTAGFSTASVDRAVDVTVAADRVGFVGITDRREVVRLSYGSNDDAGNDTARTGREAVELLTVRNNLPQVVAYRVTVAGDGTGPPNALSLRVDDETDETRPGNGERRSTSDETRLSSGETATVVARVVCGAGGASDAIERWEVRITAIGDGWRATLSRNVTVRCTGPP